jgi:hypothetical protein
MPYQLHDPHVLVAHIHYNVYTSCYTSLPLPVEALIEMEGCAGAPGPQEKRQHEVTKLGFIISDCRPTNKARVRLVLVPHLVVEERCAFTYMVGFSRIIDR